MLKIMLKSLRVSNNLTQDELAKKLEISRVRYNNYETGKRSPDLATLQQIADFFGVTTDFLIGHGDPLNTNTEMQPLSAMDLQRIDEELEQLLKKIQIICSELISKSKMLDSDTKIALYRSLKAIYDLSEKIKLQK
ncbi:MAG: helix-turn-helix transcriptional regulator, partial [Vallitaleaceae bacterium]|nr:helix-turn-helix transcriptional regulator [Vallitaleaceae bacterium]